jgi:hypothetical protein
MPPLITSRPTLGRRDLMRTVGTAAIASQFLPSMALAQSAISDELRIANEETPYGLDPVHE